MTWYYSATVVLWLAVCFVHYTAALNNGGYLGFVDLSSISYVNTVPINSYGSLDITTGFKFGDSYVHDIYVSTNGYISMESTPQYDTLPDFPLSAADKIVAPFADYIDTSAGGYVHYTDFLQSYSYNSQIDGISDFIQTHTTDEFFYGDRMMVAEWNNVRQFSGHTSTINRFQAILIDNLAGDSYAVFIYDCDTMEWGGGVIGWQASSSDYVANDLSGQSNSNDIACLYSSTSSAIVYRISSCSNGDFSCDNRQCVENYDQCDGVDDCGDNSDEQDCSVNVGAIIGGTIAAFFVVIFITIIFAISCSVRLTRRRRLARLHACIIATPGPSVTVASVSTTSSSQGAPLLANEHPPPTSYNYAPHQPPQQAPQVLVNPVATGHSPSPQQHPVATGQHPSPQPYPVATGHSPFPQPHPVAAGESAFPPPHPPPYSAQGQLYTAYPPPNH